MDGELIDFTCGDWPHLDPRAELLDVGPIPVGCVTTDLRLDDARIARLAAQRFTRDRRALVWSLARSPAEQLLRDAKGSDRAAWSDNREESCQDEFARPCTEGRHVADGGMRATDAGRAFEGRPSSVRQRGEIENAESGADRKELGICPMQCRAGRTGIPEFCAKPAWNCRSQPTCAVPGLAVRQSSSLLPRILLALG
jgi:hypothetical protein